MVRNEKLRMKFKIKSQVKNSFKHNLEYCTETIIVSRYLQFLTVAVLNAIYINAVTFFHIHLDLNKVLIKASAEIDITLNQLLLKDCGVREVHNER